jgi:hypothetical protein
MYNADEMSVPQLPSRWNADIKRPILPWKEKNEREANGTTVHEQ